MSTYSSIAAPPSIDADSIPTAITTASNTSPTASSLNQPQHSPISAAATTTHSAAPSLIDPPDFAALVVGGIAAAVLSFCLVGSLVHWLQQRRRRKIREELQRELEQESRWHSSPSRQPPPGTDISAPLPRDTGADLLSRAHPKMYSPSVGLQIDSGKIGMAVGADVDQSDIRTSYQSHSSNARLAPSRDPSNRTHYGASQEDHRFGRFEDDDPTMNMQPHEAYHTLDPQNSRPQGRSALRPRHERPQQKSTPPPLSIPSKKYSGAAPIRICAPIRERQTPVRAAGNAHARNKSLTTTSTLFTMKSLLEVQPRAPSYLPEYYTSNLSLLNLQSPADEVRSPIEQFRDTVASSTTTSTYSGLPSSNLQPTPRIFHNYDPSPNFAPRTPIEPIMELSPRLSTASSATTFESLDSADITPPEQFQPQTSQASPITPRTSGTVLYPKIPRSAGQKFPRAGFFTSPQSSPRQPSGPSNEASTLTTNEPRSPTKERAKKGPLSAPLQRGLPITLSTSSTSSSSATSFASTSATSMSTSAAPINFSHPSRPRPRRLHTASASVSALQAAGTGPPTSWRGVKPGATPMSPPLSTGRSSNSGVGSPLSARMGSMGGGMWTAGCGAIEVALRSPILSGA